MSLSRIENKAELCRITCGWKKPELPIDWVRLYWRDVHSPAISRRQGIYDYRHYQYDFVEINLLRTINGIDYKCPANEQLMWTSDVRYLSENALKIFDKSPSGEPKENLLGDIELIVDKSTTYRAIKENGFTFVDNTGVPTPQGSCPSPTFALFFRKRSNEQDFRNFLRKTSENWSSKAGVIRLRLSLFDAPDMEKERQAGYPVKTHPEHQQYQASIEISLDTFIRGLELVSQKEEKEFSKHIKAIHAYPVRSIYTSIYNGKPTIVGLRGFPAYQAIMALKAKNQVSPSLLEWMYGSIAKE